MTDITPPPELVQQWRESGPADAAINNAYECHIATQAAQWGADQELEACLRLVEIDAGEDAYDFARYIRAARRPLPKPPSLKEQALEALEDGDTGPGASLTSNEVDIIRRALEQLDD
jgi:hypothetical protein